MSNNCPYQSKRKKKTKKKLWVLLTWGGRCPGDLWPLPHPPILTLAHPNSSLSVNNPGGSVWLERSLSNGWWLCVGGVAPPTQEVGSAIVFGMSLCAFWCCCVLVAMFVDFRWGQWNFHWEWEEVRQGHNHLIMCVYGDWDLLLYPLTFPSKHVSSYWSLRTRPLYPWKP